MLVGAVVTVVLAVAVLAVVRVVAVVAVVLVVDEDAFWHLEHRTEVVRIVFV